jgi:hypothetical protein
MAVPFNVELSMPEPPAEAQARAAEALKDPTRSLGLRLSKRAPDELTYSVRYQFPFVRMLYHMLNGERMTVRFAPGPDGGTAVTIDGATARGRAPLAADPEHWTEALGGSAG